MISLTLGNVLLFSYWSATWYSNLEDVIKLDTQCGYLESDGIGSLNAPKLLTVANTEVNSYVNFKNVSNFKDLLNKTKKEQIKFFKSCVIDSFLLSLTIEVCLCILSSSYSATPKKQEGDRIYFSVLYLSFYSIAINRLFQDVQTNVDALKVRLKNILFDIYGSNREYDKLIMESPNDVSWCKESVSFLSKFLPFGVLLILCYRTA